MFYKKLDRIVEQNNSLLCVGLDSDIKKIHQNHTNDLTPQFNFNKVVIDATHDLVCAYKPNCAFYEARGADGIKELKMTCDYLRSSYPEIPIILDAKRADIENTNEGYVTYAYDYLGVDAITLHPYVGREAIRPFLDRKEKGCIILCRTTNSGSEELQGLVVEGRPLYQIIAEKVANEWNTNGNCGLVMGATYPAELGMVRRIVGDTMLLLVPGIGVQGGDLENILKNGLNSQKKALIINASRSIIFASNEPDFAQKIRNEALRLRDSINVFRIHTYDST